MTALTASTPQARFLGNVLEQARAFRHDALDDLRDAVGGLESAMFTGGDQRLFTAITELLDEGRVPTPAAVRTLKLEGFTGEHAARYLDQAGQLGEWSSYVQPILREHTQKVLVQGLTEALRAAQAGQLDEARTLGAQTLDEAPSWTSQALHYIEDFAATQAPEPRIPTPWPRVNEHLGGGLGFTGNSVVSLWIADSGVGKSSVTQQMIPGWLAAGHHVLYCFGEGRRDDITREVTRFQAGLGYAELKFGQEQAVPRTLDRYAAAARALSALPGRLAVYDEEFDGQAVRDLARRYRRQLSRDLEAGVARPGARLIVIVDNIDSAVSFDSKRFAREDQAYEYEAKRFEQAAKTEGYHLMLLSQTNEDGRRRQGAPEKSDIARAKALMNRAAFVVTLHRPVTDADRTQQDKDGEKGRRARTWIAVRKARGGVLAELEFETNARTGEWYDPRQPAF
ncbi:DnaB-like helicase C-terminal domain-containing protein [Deinococcus aerophilus]|uniref:SF4 helicase domain-containing protein n=1 Tax=Deinococcus aerophilus TaxID=522488 RepID=A0ABQ2GXV6_9DEIO|nr:DnaB-like helicase C-terminal domain-containing protein [Deinococcus aerophilus]GGM16337.1 hypothetical protein GCM10010841_25840 [Deinococcus aerophilus]